MLNQAPVVRDLVLVGGGHSHVIVLRMLAMAPIPGLQVTLVSPDVRSAYSGMLPGLVAGHYSSDDMHIELVPLCQFAGARFVRSAVHSIDPVAKRVKLDGRPDLPYDVLSLDIGITPALGDVTGGEDNGIAVKPINSFIAKWSTFLSRVEAGQVKSVGVVGAGAGGVELSLAIQHRIRKSNVAFHLFADDELLAGYPEKVQQSVRRHLKQRNITFHEDFRAISFENRTLMSATGQQCSVDDVFFVTRAAAQGWLKDTGLNVDANGFVTVRETLQSTNFDDVFAVGDTATVIDDPRPKAGVYAVRQGPPLYRNIRRYVLGQSPRPFKAQKEFLSLLSLGDKHAIASRNGMSTEGAWVWHWKNWIDRRFMDRFNDLPAMKQKKQGGLLADFDDQMRCGGCGSKVSADLLHEVLTSLNVAQDQLDDAAEYAVPEGRVILQSVDAFRAFIDDPFTFAQVTVNHALSDIYAMGGKPVTALAIVTLPYATPTKTRELLEQLLGGARKVLDAEQVALAGGHTTEGPELSLGFSVTGIAEPSRLLHKGGSQAGDVLVLTKPLGTGVIFAAQMQLKARGAHVEAALQTMLQSNRAAASLMVTHGATAATDVTGFGLAGHLQEMMVASGTAARLSMRDIPLLPGAREAIDAGISSTLFAGNQRSVTAQVTRVAGTDVIFDPQTAGGLLISVPAGRVDALLADLKAAGYDSAAVIGEVVLTDSPRIAVT